MLIERENRNRWTAKEIGIDFILPKLFSKNAKNLSHPIRNSDNNCSKHSDVIQFNFG